MGAIKIKSFFNQPLPYFMNSRGRIKHGDYCRGCGAKLKTELSKKRGYGRCCFKKLTVQVVLEIIPDAVS